ncbi:MAG: hypothetical protein ACI9OJ_002094 [Myxococcota bacterium]
MRYALIRPNTNTIREDDANLQHPTNQHEHAPVDNPPRKARHQTLMMNPFEECLQVQVNHPRVSSLEMLSGLGNCRVATPSGAKAVTARMKRRLEQRLE